MLMFYTVWIDHTLTYQPLKSTADQITTRAKCIIGVGWRSFHLQSAFFRSKQARLGNDTSWLHNCEKRNSRWVCLTHGGRWMNRPTNCLNIKYNRHNKEASQSMCIDNLIQCCFLCHVRQIMEASVLRADRQTDMRLSGSFFGQRS